MTYSQIKAQLEALLPALREAAESRQPDYSESSLNSPEWLAYQKAQESLWAIEKLA